MKFDARMRNGRFTKEANNDCSVLNPYVIRKEIDEGSRVHCLAFTWPLMQFSSDDESTDNDNGGNQLEKEL